ncbi:MAG: hypothetical protein R3F11_20250 [Verrucomicrobiales bacterium]
MKCPIPSEANVSPEFQLVRPATVPPHSFFQIWSPIFFASAGVSRICADPSARLVRGGGGAGLVLASPPPPSAAQPSRENETRWWRR